jgi:hypothetical protein
LPPGSRGVTPAEDPERGRGYCTRGAIRRSTGADGDGDSHEMGDGGFTRWTALLMNDSRERSLISCAATGRRTS